MKPSCCWKCCRAAPIAATISSTGGRGAIASISSPRGCKTRDLAIAAYDTADPAVRGRLDILAGTMTAVLEATRAALCADLPDAVTDDLADRATARLKPLVARAGAVINGEADVSLPQTPQAVVDGLMKSPS